MITKQPKADDLRHPNASSTFGTSRPPHKIPISCMFLSNFEMKRGNITVWSRKWSETNCDVDLENIEFKSLPSGMHEVSNDVINFVLPKEIRGEDYYYGVAYYKQNGQEISEESTQLDRNDVKMYALGVIVNPNYRASGISNSGFYDWKPNQFTSANEYVNDLQDLLTHWLAKRDYQDFTLFEDYFNSNSLTNNAAGLASPVLQRSGKLAREFLSREDQIASGESRATIRPQMLEYLPYWIRKLGPLIFPLWKSCLLNERVLILNPPGGSFELCNALNYCLSIISLTPKVLQVNRHEDYFVRPLFTIGISDIDTMVSEVKQAAERKQKVHGFVACTSDEILTCRTELYDKLLRIPADKPSEDSEEATLFSSSGVQIKATPHDFESLELFYSSYFNEEMSLTEKTRLSKSVEAVTWMQYLIDGFYWWATAGYVKPSYHEFTSVEQRVMEDEYNDVEMILDIVGYFHDKTTSLHNKLKAIIESNEHHGSEDTIFIPSMVFGEMDLDCFSLQDQRLVVALARRWFQKEVRVSGDFCKAIC